VTDWSADPASSSNSLIGGPWTENYVKAAALHDFFNIRRSMQSAPPAVHEMFYQATPWQLGTPQGNWRRASENVQRPWPILAAVGKAATWAKRSTPRGGPQQPALDDVISRAQGNVGKRTRRTSASVDAQAADRSCAFCANLWRPETAGMFTNPKRRSGRSFDLDAFVGSDARATTSEHFERDASLIAALRRAARDGAAAPGERAATT
jgi:hypothetical protein